jgi:nucleoside-diphosphate-sugar epimerase
VFNIAHQEKVSVNRLAAMVLEQFGLETDGNVQYQPVRKGDVKHSLADISKARDELGYRPKFSMKEGLSLTIANPK